MHLVLNNGVAIPQLGFGTYKVEPGDAVAVVREALEIGYRHVDTAQMYGNEREVGQAVRESGLLREDVFLTTKLNNNQLTYDDAMASFDRSLDELGLDFVDLFLIHWPLATVSDFVPRWKALEEIYRSGRARAIGVSNFQEHHLVRLMEETEIVPAVNQIEIHPYLVQDELRAFDAKHGIVTQAWSPLGRGAVLGDPTIAEIAGRHDASPAQVIIRWHVQRGDVVFPKASSRARIEENFRALDLRLTDDDMAAITALDRGERTGSHPDTMAWIP
ncbi:aldo/keto reductase [Sanguibacter hominis ATCC BAA-789]|uniref:Aldo/keto reductase n=1 Tax=Sanguibacter hominis ATCC BAA-789 TaxID=1312740 RepID=A0A9X5FBG1_9MICO|nr:aldo/keto reductase [Sanguibacter hominis]NKX93115.1 aldo/keto reductase [Sanguibacter hominis ATCC BAA-789]